MEEDYVMIPGSGTKKIIRDVKKEIETAFLDYSMSVIVSRALPDVRDGLKPVHRRILYTMHENNLTPDKAYRKCADLGGQVSGEHGIGLSKRPYFLRQTAKENLQAMNAIKTALDPQHILNNGKSYLTGGNNNAGTF